MSSSEITKNLPICAFVDKILRIIADPRNFDIETEKKIVRWSDDGKFILIEEELFKKTLLKRFFHHASITSFVRQLNAHGFKKIKLKKYLTAVYGQQLESENNNQDINKNATKNIRTKYHDKYIYFRPESFEKKISKNKKLVKKIQSDDDTIVDANNNNMDDVMIYQNPNFVRDKPEHYNKIQRENSRQQFMILSESDTNDIFGADKELKKRKMKSAPSRPQLIQKNVTINTCSLK